ncbi:response regulator [beta proteobacterium MWH-UniP1]
MTLNRPFQPTRVLIVEDEPELRKILRALIESIGFPVDEATNRQDGLAMLGGDRDIGIVLLDLGLPPATDNYSEGILFLQKAQTRSSLTKVIVLTGRDTPDVALQAIEYGAADYLTKPFDGASLVNAVKRAAFYHQKQSILLEQSKVSIHLVADTSKTDSVQCLKDQTMSQLIRTVLTEVDHNISKASRRLNVSREHLYYYIKKYDIHRPEE